VIWKINARADVIETELFTILRDAGLYLVYMGLESGSDDGLDVLNKGLSVEQNLKAVETLRSIGLMFQYGFMLFDPSTTFNSVRENLDFLRTITHDGSLGATFCRMLPYDGTAIKDQLAAEGRLRGDVTNPDYKFLDPRIDGLFREVNETQNVVGWIHGMRSLSPQLDWAWHEVAVTQRLFSEVRNFDFYKDRLSSITKQANEMLFDLVEEMSFAHEAGRPGRYDVKEIEFECHRLNQQLLAARNEFVLSNQSYMLGVLGVGG